MSAKSKVLLGIICVLLAISTFRHYPSLEDIVVFFLIYVLVATAVGMIVLFLCRRFSPRCPACRARYNDGATICCHCGSIIPPPREERG